MDSTTLRRSTQPITSRRQVVERAEAFLSTRVGESVSIAQLCRVAGVSERSLRNAFYGVPISEILHPRGFARLWTAHFVIDETTAMAVSQATPRARRCASIPTGARAIPAPAPGRILRRRS
jgi:hypothetical protein